MEEVAEYSGATAELEEGEEENDEEEVVQPMGDRKMKVMADELNRGQVVVPEIKTMEVEVQQAVEPKGVEIEIGKKEVEPATKTQEKEVVQEAEPREAEQVIEPAIGSEEVASEPMTEQVSEIEGEKEKDVVVVTDDEEDVERSTLKEVLATSGWMLLRNVGLKDEEGSPLVRRPRSRMRASTEGTAAPEEGQTVGTTTPQAGEAASQEGKQMEEPAGVDESEEERLRQEKRGKGRSWQSLCRRR